MPGAQGADASGARRDAIGPVRITLRPIANPFALGFVGLAVATIIASGIELDWVRTFETHSAAVLILAFAPVLQILSSVVGFLARDAVAATGMGVLGATWLAVGLSLLLGAPGTHNHALGLLLFVAATAITFSALTAAQTKLVPAIVMALAAVRFVLTGAYELGNGTGWGHAAGWTGVALCVVALYGALSLEVEDIKHRTVLPTLRHGKGREVLEGDLAEQVEQVEHEAGVRAQL